MTRFAGYELWFYGGIFLMAIAGILFTVQTVVYIVKKSAIHKKLDEEYGQPQKYHMKEKR